MTPVRRKVILISIMTAMLAIAALWSYGSAKNAKGMAGLACEDYLRCDYLAGEIRNIRHKPAVAAEKDMAVNELASLVEKSSARAGMTAASVQGISPQSSRRMGNSSYIQNPTEISLKDVRLAQLASFLYHICDSSALEATDLRIWVPYGNAAGDKWDAEVTLSYLVYSPQTKNASAK